MRLLITALLAACAFGAQAFSAVSAPPLAQSLSGVKVGRVADSDVTLVPIITWGGDIATLVANGNSLSTAPGSVFAKEGLNLKLFREDVFPKQVEAYLSGRTPYLRGTVGMAQMASELLCKEAFTCPRLIYQLTWSAGGDALVVGGNIRTVADLKGKRIAVQAYGPHIDYVAKILSDANLTLKDVTIVWARDLTGTQESPGETLLSGKADAAAVIIPDALALTSGNTVGTGAEGSVKGAKILLSTKTASRIIADAYFVRPDYLRAHPEKVRGFVHGLMLGAEKLQATVEKKDAAYGAVFKSAAQALLDSASAVPDAEGLYADAQFVGFNGNVSFITSATDPRRFDVLSREAGQALATVGLVSSPSQLAAATLDFEALRVGLAQADAKAEVRFDKGVVANVVTRRQQQDRLNEGELFSFEIFFDPNQNGFSPDLYAKDFDRVAQLASTYAGAIITVEGHSDPMGWLRKKKEGESPVVLSQIKQSARNLSLARAASVRDSLVAYSKSKGVALDPDQFALVAQGIAKPATGLCGEDPCAPKSEREWRSNMRVQFRIVQVEAESSVFKPL